MDAMAKAKKLTPLGKVELRVSAWSCGTPDQFNVHAQQAITVIKQGMRVGTEKECTKKKNRSRIGLT